MKRRVRVNAFEVRRFNLTLLKTRFCYRYLLQLFIATLNNIKYCFQLNTIIRLNIENKKGKRFNYKSRFFYPFALITGFFSVDLLFVLFSFMVYC